MLGLNLTRKNQRNAQQHIGWLNDINTCFTHDLGSGSTSLDNLTDLTIIAYFSWSTSPQLSGFNFHQLLNAKYDTTNDTGFSMTTDKMSTFHGSNASGKTSVSFNFADGSGPLTSKSATANKVQHWGKQDANVNAFRGNPCFGFACRFKASATNEMSVGVFSQNNITFNQENNDVSNSGVISNLIDLDLGDGGAKGFKEPTHLVHRISIFNSALSDLNVMKCFGFTNSTWEELDVADGDAINGCYRIAPKFQSYNDIIGTNPIHDWDFTRQDPLASGYSGTIEDTGSVGGLTLTASGSPVFGKQPQIS